MHHPAVLVVFPIFALLNAVVVFAARKAFARLLRLDDLCFLPWREPTGDRSRGGVALVVMPFAVAYLVAAAPFAAALRIGGIDDGSVSAVVDVHPEMAAAAAGIRDGDRIVAVGETAISAWSELSPLLSARAGETLVIVVERDDAQLALTAALPEDGRLGVRARPVRAPVSIGRALVLGLQRPVVVLATTARGFWTFLSGSVESELGGPVAIVSEAKYAGTRGAADHLQMIGQLNAYAGMPSALLLAFIFRPRRRPAA